MRGKPRSSGIDRAIGALAERQHGVVSRAELLELGIGRDAIDRRLQLGRLRQVHRGVYTIGHRLLTQDGRWTAAVLAYGPHAVLSHRAAAALWGMRGGTQVEVTVPGGLRGRSGIQVHRAKLPPDERTTHRTIPTTTVPRTCSTSVEQLEAASSAARFVKPSISDLPTRSRCKASRIATH